MKKEKEVTLHLEKRDMDAINRFVSNLIEARLLNEAGYGIITIDLMPMSVKVKVTSWTQEG